MSKKIIYYVQRYRPGYEAISKEVALLVEYFSKSHEVRIHDLHLDGLFNFKFNKSMRSYHFVYYPFLAFSAWSESKQDSTNHIYTSLGDLPYLKILNLEQTILTAAASCRPEKIKRRIRYLQNLRKIVVESQQQKNELISLGILGSNIELIYPPVNVEVFKYQAPKNNFTILFASCPTRASDFRKRGIYLLLETAKKLESTNFHLAWRGNAHNKIKSLLTARCFQNVTVKNEIIADANSLYRDVHATIIPYTQFDDFLKLIPNSAIESLAAGKPVLVSSRTEIANIIKLEQCGVIFEPTTEGLLNAIAEIKKNYQKYQKNCRGTAEKYFSKDIFIKKYEQIYAELP